MGDLTAKSIVKAAIVTAVLCFTADPVIALAQDWTHRRQDPVYPNRPSGMTLIGYSDGSVLGGIAGTPTSGEPAFGIPGFGPWWEFSCSKEPHWPHERLHLVDDPSNPTGSGKAIRFDILSSGCGAIATARPIQGSPYREIYIRFRLNVENDRDRNIKLFYLATENISGVSGDAYFSLMGSGAFRLTVLDRIYSVSGVFPVGMWATVEIHAVGESAGGAEDGEYHVYVNGQHARSWTGVRWAARASAGDGHQFNKLQWYAHHSNRGWGLSYRIGEFYMAGK